MSKRVIDVVSITCTSLVAISIGAATTSTAYAQSLPNPTRLAVLWEVNAGVNGFIDYMTTASSAERNNYPFLGAIAYIRGDTSVNPLYRLYNSSDHMDSNTPGEGGYGTDGPLGSTWSGPNAVVGLAAISRIINTRTGDNATTVPNTSSLLGSSQYSGYQTVGTLGYGYQRYGNASQLLQTYSGGGITEGSDYIAGGAIASWSWNGAQFVNSTDYGRYMQSDFYFSNPNNNIVYNPIEAGDHFSGSGQPGTWHGSPVLVNQVSNGVHTTRAIPLEYGIQVDGLTGYPITVDAPYIYSGMQIGKDLTLNFANLGPVGQYVVTVNTPVAVANMHIEVPSAYLNKPYGTFFTVDAKSNVTTNVTPGDNCPGGSAAGGGVNYHPPSGAGGIIASDSTLSHAIGIYRRVGPNPAVFQLNDFRNCFDGPTKIVANAFGSLSAGTNTFTSYVISGTVSQVSSLMSQLYKMNY